MITIEINCFVLYLRPKPKFSKTQTLNPLRISTDLVWKLGWCNLYPQCFMWNRHDNNLNNCSSFKLIAKCCRQLTFLCSGNFLSDWKTTENLTQITTTTTYIKNIAHQRLPRNIIIYKTSNRVLIKQLRLWLRRLKLKI